MTEEALAMLSAHDWPGNVRELKNIIERLIILTPSNEIRHPIFPNSTLSKPNPEQATGQSVAAADS